VEAATKLQILPKFARLRMLSGGPPKKPLVFGELKAASIQEIAAFSAAALSMSTSIGVTEAHGRLSLLKSVTLRDMVLI